MKKYFLFYTLFCLTTGLSGQNKTMEQLFQKYSDKDGFTSVVITKNMFQLFANIDNENNDDFLRTLKNLDFIKILTTKGEDEGKLFYQEILEAIPEKDYKELMTIKETGKMVKFLTLEKDGIIKELIMVSGSKEESAMIWLTGIIDMKAVSKIAQGMKMEGMENLEKVDKLP